MPDLYLQWAWSPLDLQVSEFSVHFISYIIIHYYKFPQPTLKLNYLYSAASTWNKSSGNSAATSDLDIFFYVLGGFFLRGNQKVWISRLISKWFFIITFIIQYPFSPYLHTPIKYFFQHFTVRMINYELLDSKDSLTTEYWFLIGTSRHCEAIFYKNKVELCWKCTISYVLQMQKEKKKSVQRGIPSPSQKQKKSAIKKSSEMIIEERKTRIHFIQR